MFQRSVAFPEHKFGFHHYLIPASLLNLADAYKQLGRGFGERLSLLDRAAAIFELSIERSKPESAGPLANALILSAGCCEEAGRLGEAEARWARCMGASAQVCRWTSLSPVDALLFHLRIPSAP